ncbi:MAG: DNRLRE domain-containing protein [Verrucomicrobiota bacterium]
MTTALGLLAPRLAADPQPLLPGTWTLEFQDEFDGDTLDGSKWRLGGHYGGIAGAGANAPENITVSDGSLQIKAEQRAATFSGANYNYAAGEISTFFNYRQQYGYMEARIKYPAVTGLWPAFWLMPDRGTYGWQGNYRRAYLKFDLTAQSIPTVTSAVLKLKISAMETGGINNIVCMKLADDIWSESTITWNNKPVPDPLWIAQKWNNAVTVGDTISIDVTDYVAQQLAGDKTVSLVLADTYMRTKLFRFHSKEAANAADRPVLVINGVSHPVTEDATVQWGTYSNTNYGSLDNIAVKDDWGNTADTYGGGMEVDIMESLGIWGPDVTQHALHWDGYGANHKTVHWPDINPDATPDGFHTYGVYWEPGLFAFYVDGIKTGEYADARVMSVPAYLLLSLQLGGWANNNPGSQVNNQTMEVDWVRTWSGTRAAPATVTVDNTDATDIDVAGTWSASSHSAGYIGADYAHDGNTGKGAKSFTYLPPLLADADYLIYARWTSDPNRATNVPYDIRDAGNNVSTVTVNQQTGGGQWNLLGVHDLAVLNAEVTIRTTGTNGHVIADALRFKPLPTTGEIVIDNTDTAHVTTTGSWTGSTGTPGYLGTDYLHDGNTAKGTKSVSFKPALSTSGDYLVYARWTAAGNRANNVPVDIVKSNGTTATVTVDQQVNGNTWQLLGVFPLSTTNAEITFRTTGTSGYVIADAIKVLPVGTP